MNLFKKVPRLFANDLFLLILLPLLVGVLAILPKIFIWKNLFDNHKPFLAITYLSNSDETLDYYPRMREIYDGRFPPADLSMDLSVVSPRNLLPSVLGSLSLFLFHGNVNLSYLAIQFLFNIIVFLAFYFWATILFKSRPWALFTGLLATLTPMVTVLGQIMLGENKTLNILVKNFYPLVKTPIYNSFIARFDYPLITLAIYVPALAALTSFWFSPRKRTAVISGLLFGMLFYSYLHDWIYFAILVFLLLIYSLLDRFNNPARFKLLILFLVVATVVAIPYFISYFTFINSAYAHDFCNRTCVIEYGRYLHITGYLSHYAAYSFLALVVYLIFWKKHRHRAVPFLTAIVAIVLAYNIQVVTGYTFASGHWERQFYPIALLIILNILHELSVRLVESKRVIVAILAVLMGLLLTKKIVNAFIFYNNLPVEIAEKHMLKEGIIDSWQWTDDLKDKEPRIISPSVMTAMYLNVYTGARPYLPYWPHSFATTYEIEQRYLVSHKLFEVTSSVLSNRILSRLDNLNCESLLLGFSGNIVHCTPHTPYNLADLWKYIYGDTLFPQKPSYRTIPASKLNELLVRYGNLQVDWHELEADYVYYGPWEKEIVMKDFSKEAGLKLVYQNPTIEIYKIKR